MKLKSRPQDFRVRELLEEGYVGPSGPFRVYRVTKRKRTSGEAAARLAEAAGVDRTEVSLAGLKDRQGITIQHMSVPGGRDARIAEPELRIEPIGFATEALESRHSRGNAFDVTVRALERADLDLLRRNLPLLRRVGLPNYFDDQRFGNLRHGQGWIARDLAFGELEKALRALVASSSPHDSEREERTKADLRRAWGDWDACVSIARRTGQHRSVFERLASDPSDFVGAIQRVSARVRLIHLYAFQSHLWNRAVAELVRSEVPAEDRVVVRSVEGPLVCPAREPLAVGRGTFRLPGPGLEDVTDRREWELLADALAHERMVPDQLRIEGVPGFQLKGEDRALVVHPAHLRVRPSERDPMHRGGSLVRLRFELPRGAYATLVVKRLFAGPRDDSGGGSRPRDRGPRRGLPVEKRGERRKGGRNRCSPGGRGSNARPALP